jgi:hypothetical protein
MAVTTYYTLSISGVLGQPYDPASGIESQWRAVFGDAPSNDGKPRLSLAQMAADADLPWPAGFLRPNVEVASRKLTGAFNRNYDLGGGWEIEEWEIGVEPAANGAQTKLTFLAEAEFKGNGGIDDHKESQKRDAEWFFEHATKQWHQTLKARLIAFNNDHKDMIAPAWLQEFEFYCGNGGGGGE